MDTVRRGFRRAKAVSWALVGVGIASAAGTSAFAYVDTATAMQATTPADVGQEALTEQVAPPLEVPAIPIPVEATVTPDVTAPPSPIVAPTVPVDVATASPSPIPDEPQTTQPPSYPTAITAAPPTIETPRSATSRTPRATTTRRSTPTTRSSPNYSPGLGSGSGSSHTQARGS